MTETLSFLLGLINAAGLLVHCFYDKQRLRQYIRKDGG